MKRLFKIVALVGTLALLIGIVLTVIDIALRNATSGTVVGIIDIMQLCVLVSSMLAIPYGFLSNQHVAIDVFSTMMSKRVQHGLHVFAALLGIVFLCGVLWFSSTQMIAEGSFGDRSLTLGIPMFWFWVPFLLGVVLSAVANLYLVFRPAVNRQDDEVSL